MQDQTFTARLTVAERAPWCSYVSVIRELLGNTKVSKYWNLVDVMLQNFQALGTSMSIKLHYLFSHLDYFPENLGDISEEQEKRFHQDIRKMEERYRRSRLVRHPNSIRASTNQDQGQGLSFYHPGLLCCPD